MMQPRDLVNNYPRLFHIAWAGSWPSIKEHGLLSTKALIELYELDADESMKLVCEHRPHWVEIYRKGLPRAVIRDQKPMSDEGLRQALGGRVEPGKWYKLLNSMVFFWPTKKRLMTMLSAKAYRGMRHDVIIVDTQKLLERKEREIRISPMNSGATKPFSYPRGMGIFRELRDYPFEERMKKYSVEGAVAEVCVRDRVEEIATCVQKVKTVTAEEAAKWVE